MIGRLVSVIVITVTTGLVANQDQVASLKGDVENFNMSLGFASKLEAYQLDTFIGIIDEQKTEIEVIKQRYQKDANAIIKDSSIDLDVRLAKLKDLLSSQDAELEKVLLPHQLERFEQWSVFRTIMGEGLANSITNGLIAGQLELTNDQRLKVREASKIARAQYEKDAIAAQKKAIGTLKKSLPESKTKKFDEIMEPLLSDEGTLWEDSYQNMLDASDKMRVFLIRTLPKIKENDTNVD